MAKMRTTPRTAKTTHTQTETPESSGVGVGVSPPLSASSPGTVVEDSSTASTVVASSVLF